MLTALHKALIGIHLEQHRMLHEPDQLILGRILIKHYSKTIHILLPLLEKQHIQIG